MIAQFVEVDNYYNPNLKTVTIKIVKQILFIDK